MHEERYCFIWFTIRGVWWQVQGDNNMTCFLFIQMWFLRSISILYDDNLYVSIKPTNSFTKQRKDRCSCKGGSFKMYQDNMSLWTVFGCHNRIYSNVYTLFIRRTVLLKCSSTLFFCLKKEYYSSTMEMETKILELYEEQYDLVVHRNLETPSYFVDRYLISPDE